MEIKKYLIVFLLSLPISICAQEFISDKRDTTVITEYYDGHKWAYRQIGNCIVGMTNYVDRNDYGKYYKILIFIKNIGDKSLTFNPLLVTSTLYNKRGETKNMTVYTYEDYMKKVKNTQAWSMALLGFSTGLNSGMAGYQTTYTSTMNRGMPYTQVQTTYNPAAASVANLAATTQMITLSKVMSDDKKVLSQGYLKMNTIHPNEGIVGYMNIKYKKGQRMRIDIPIGGNTYIYYWDITYIEEY